MCEHELWWVWPFIKERSSSKVKDRDEEEGACLLAPNRCVRLHVFPAGLASLRRGAGRVPCQSPRGQAASDASGLRYDLLPLTPRIHGRRNVSVRQNMIMILLFL
ncbi:unnamed protein product [Hapterophycus canaliculatus]